MFKKVLLCHDGSEHGRRALRRGADLAILVDAEVRVLSIISDEVTPPVLAAVLGHACYVDVNQERQDALNASVKWLNDRGVRASGALTRGNIICEIVRHAQREQVDLIVLGHYPTPTGRRWWSGPDQASLAEQVKCCVLIAVSADGVDSSMVRNASVAATV